ncbi:MAG: helix-turn-helix transcriptional regulator [Clostridia bacterium]|nr:helix-turn-helix transcriptional regulator [Clostridia bacterium]
MNTYEKLTALCEERGVRLSAVAAATGIRSSVFTELKSGRTRRLSTGTLTKLSDYFEVPVAFLLDDADNVPDEQEELFRMRKVLFDASAKVKKDDLDKIIKLVEAIAKDG